MKLAQNFLLVALSTAIICSATTPVLARGGSDSFYRSSTFGGTHYVRSYFKSNGSYVSSHRSGNPGSGM